MLANYWYITKISSKYKEKIKVVDISNCSSKDIGNLGERAVVEYLHRLGFAVQERNASFKTGEIDVIAEKGKCLHFVEVKTVRCLVFPQDIEKDEFSPANNLHANKIRKVVRTAQWYMAKRGWEGEWQVDGALVWLRTDLVARIRYYPQIA